MLWTATIRDPEETDKILATIEDVRTLKDLSERINNIYIAHNVDKTITREDLMKMTSKAGEKLKAVQNNKKCIELTKDYVANAKTKVYGVDLNIVKCHYNEETEMIKLVVKINGKNRKFTLVSESDSSEEDNM